MDQSVGRSTEIIPTTMYKSPALKAGTKIPTHRRMPVGPPRQNVAFTGYGIVPDYMTEHSLVMWPIVSSTTLEDGFVNGRECMMPPAGYLPAMQKGQALDSGAGGAGSFATVVAYQAKG